MLMNLISLVFLSTVFKYGPLQYNGDHTALNKHSASSIMALNITVTVAS